MTEEEDEFFDSESEPSFINDLDISSKLNNLSITSEKTSDKQQPYVPIYAVQFLNKNKSNNNLVNINQITNRIFINQENAMKLCKQDPDNRRFKVFKNFHEAYTFSYETSEIESGQAPSKEQIQATLSVKFPSTTKNSKNQANNSELNNKPSSAQDAEKLPFSAPKKPEVNEMRSFIEKNNFECFRDKVISNPRFLITAGDAPEGFRYNALHVCAKENRHNICQLILNLLNSTAFLMKMYKNDTFEQSRARSHHLLDLYLNTPEKGLNETPLHFATKFGSYEVARLLISFDICSKTVKNKNGKSPDEIICTKATNQSAKEKFDSIKSLFEECFYVPLFRDDEKGDVLIDKPSSKLVSTINQNDFETNKSSYVSPKKTSISQTQRKLAGYVGPVSPTVANEIYERLKSPAKLRRSPNNLDILRSDEFKGYERIMRKLADELSLPWYEYWGFLDSYCNLKSKEGVEKLEIYLEQKKIQNILETQIKSAQVILNDKLNNNSKESNENNDQQQLLIKLEYFLNQIEQLKVNLELKENLLSHKYEKFVKKMQDNPTSFTQINQNSSDSLLNEENSNEFLINEILNRYMSVIIELSRLDKTSKCYFNFYKTSKTLLELLNCQKSFDNFHLSPVFKRISNTLPNITSRALNNTTNISNWTPKANNSFNSYQIRKPVFEDSDEEDEFLIKKNTKSNEDEENYDNVEDDLERDYDDAEDSMIDHLKQNENSDLLNDLEQVTIKMNSNFLNQEKPKTNTKASNPFKLMINSSSNNNYKNSNKVEEDDYKLNDINKKIFDLNKDNKCKLFMFGDNPSKLDRAVYLAIQDVNIDSSRFKLLNEWYIYMKSIKHSEMQKWRTPIRQNTISRTKLIN